MLEGDVNRLIGEVIAKFDNPCLPGLCTLDPEGLELDWDTVVTCAQHRQHGTPYELFIYFSTPGAARSAGVQQEKLIDANEGRLTALFGSADWKQIANLQRRRQLPPGEAGRRYLNLYESRLRDLGYSTIKRRPALREERGLVYHLIFATANEAGGNIMEDAMRRAGALQLGLPM